MTPVSMDEPENPVKLLKFSDIKRCPIQCLLPSHYREDGTCRCFPTDAEVDRRRQERAFCKRTRWPDAEQADPPDNDR